MRLRDNNSSSLLLTLLFKATTNATDHSFTHETSLSNWKNHHRSKLRDIKSLRSRRSGGCFKSVLPSAVNGKGTTFIIQTKVQKHFIRGENT